MEHQVFPRTAATVSQARWRDGKNFSWRRNQPDPLPRGSWTAVATTTSRPHSSRDVSVGAGGGSADPARTSTKGAAPTTPPGGVINSMRQGSIVGSVGPLYGPAGNGHTHVRASRTVPRARTSLGRQRAILGRAAGGRSGAPSGRTRWALLTSYAFRDDTIGSRGFIAAVTRTAWPRPFGGAGCGPVSGPVAGRT